MSYKDKKKEKAYQHALYRKRMANETPEERVSRLAYQREYQMHARGSIRAWYAGLKKTLSCIVCGENRSECLDFHHRAPGQDNRGISFYVRNRAAKDRVLKEMDKCDVLCANCHRHLHWGMKQVEVAKVVST